MSESRVLYTVGQSDNRPWGTWEVLAIGPDYIVKRIVVNPGGQLSDQRHFCREEIWSLVEGCGVVTLDDGNVPSADFSVTAGQTVNIPLGCWHLMRNNGDKPMVFIEIQRAAGPNGKLDEDDIERRSDIYGRVASPTPDTAIVEAQAEVLDVHRT